MIKIYSMTHKKFEVPADSMYCPLHVGKAGGSDLGYPGDDTGDNISDLNCYYSELTGLYWIWKNVKNIDYVGTCHYRRYLINSEDQVLTRREYEGLLSDYDIVTTKKIRLNASYYAGFSANHNIKALDSAGEVIKEMYPQIYPVFERLVNKRETYFANMLVTSKTLFDRYAEWLFSIFFEVQKRIDLETDEDAYHKRIFGFISEFLLLVWVTAEHLKVFECKVGMLGEKAETREMKDCLADYFAKGDIQGAKEFFLNRFAERPDVLMEASDITGELGLAMQIIATAEHEVGQSGFSVLDRERDFKKLIKGFERLNRVVDNYKNDEQTDEDILFLKASGATEAAISIAVSILKVSAPQSETIRDKILRELYDA